LISEVNACVWGDIFFPHLEPRYVLLLLEEGGELLFPGGGRSAYRIALGTFT